MKPAGAEKQRQNKGEKRAIKGGKCNKKTETQKKGQKG
jgi:hypothetical protein